MHLGLRQACDWMMNTSRRDMRLNDWSVLMRCLTVTERKVRDADANRDAVTVFVVFCGMASLPLLPTRDWEKSLSHLRARFCALLASRSRFWEILFDSWATGSKCGRLLELAGNLGLLMDVNIGAGQ